MDRFPDLQCSDQFIDKELGGVLLGVTEDDIDAAIGDSMRLCVEILDCLFNRIGSAASRA